MSVPKETPVPRPNSPDAMLQRLRASVMGSGFSTLIGAEPVLCWDGRSELIIQLGEQLTQHHGAAHGAVVGAAADNACAWAAASLVGDVVTANYSIYILAPAVGERIRAHGRVVKHGRRLITAQAEVLAENGADTSLVATAIATIVAVNR